MEKQYAQYGWWKAIGIIILGFTELSGSVDILCLNVFELLVLNIAH